MDGATPDLVESSLFYADGQLCSADILTTSQVRARIEVAVLSFLKMLTSPNPAICGLPLVNRRPKNSARRRGLLSNVSTVFLTHSFSTRSFTRINDVKAFIRVWKVMEMCYKILSQQKVVTQRELFYKLICESSAYFDSQYQVNSAIQDVVSLLRCTRRSLGILASARGAIIGRLVLEGPDKDRVDCSLVGHAGHPITADLYMLGKLIFHSDARYIIIVEKDAIFQRLAEDKLFNQIPSILITAKGYPDMASRVFLHRLSQAFPDMPILALVDWNPAGLAILCIYKFGSINMGLESYRYACNVKWLGLRGEDLEFVPQEALAEMTARDKRTAKSLMSSKFLPESYKSELALMVEKGYRVEIEALYCQGFDFLGKYVVKKIVQGDYI